MLWIREEISLSTHRVTVALIYYAEPWGTMLTLAFRVLTLKRDDVLSHGNDVVLWTRLVADRSNPTGLYYQRIDRAGRFELQALSNHPQPIPGAEANFVLAPTIRSRSLQHVEPPSLPHDEARVLYIRVPRTRLVCIF